MALTRDSNQSKIKGRPFVKTKTVGFPSCMIIFASSSWISGSLISIREEASPLIWLFSPNAKMTTSASSAVRNAASKPPSIESPTAQPSATRTRFPFTASVTPCSSVIVSSPYFENCHGPSKSLLLANGPIRAIVPPALDSNGRMPSFLSNTTDLRASSLLSCRCSSENWHSSAFFGWIYRKGSSIMPSLYL
ncbi:hypothetical protein D3C81_1310160 [compost metagenome]